MFVTRDEDPDQGVWSDPGPGVWLDPGIKVKNSCKIKLVLPYSLTKVIMQYQMINLLTFVSKDKMTVNSNR